MKRTAIIIFCLLITLTIGADHLFSAEKKTAKQTWSAKASAQDYEIGAGDILEITTWKEPDFSREGILVRLDGKLTFPLLNDVQALWI
jgi:polysaccharide export outer membrane protein